MTRSLKALAQSSDKADSSKLLRTPLAGLHRLMGARMVPFAGYDMPVQFAGIIAEHVWTREHAGLFDVSHMGQARLEGPDHETTARAFEALVPTDVVGLAPGQQRYTQLLNDDGGIIDDLMVTAPQERDGTLLLVVNASTKTADYAHIEAHLPSNVRLRACEDLALLAVQGPKAAEALSRHAPEAGSLAFMTAKAMQVGEWPCWVSRSGYTGEDGFEIAVSAPDVQSLAERLLSEPEVKPIGLGARDTLRLEAGLCLYGHDIDQSTTPIEAALAWSIPRRRREQGGFPGSERIRAELREGPSRLRVGIRVEGKAPAREGVPIQDEEGAPLGAVTSGGFGPSLGGPVAMGYVSRTSASPETPVRLLVRSERRPAAVMKLPFVPHRYARKGTAS